MPGGQLPISLLPTLPSGETIQNDDLFVLVHNGTTYQYPAGFLLALIGTGGGGSGTVQQLEVLNPELISDGTICVWTIPNSLYDKFAQPILYSEVANTIETPTSVKVTADSVIYTFTTATNITVGAYRCSIQGKQKDAPIPPDPGDEYVEGDYVEGDYVL